ncbi:MAG: OmpH family outer membrane protein [Myxococcota bacterium]
MQRISSTVLVWMMTALVGLSLAGVTAAIAPEAAQAQDKQVTKLAFVDLQRALNEVEDGKKAKRKLKTMFNKRQKELDAEQEKLKKFKDELEQKIKDGLLNEEKQREEMMKYQRQFYDLQMLYAKLQKELTEAEAKETKKIFAKMRNILKDIGLAEGYTMVLEKTESSILWAPKSLDVTDVLIQRYNAGGGK